jgi:hypothetical protein
MGHVAGLPSSDRCRGAGQVVPADYNQSVAQNFVNANNAAPEATSFRLICHGIYRPKTNPYINYGGLGLRIAGKKANIKTVLDDWGVLAQRFSGIVIDGCGAAYPAL